MSLSLWDEKAQPKLCFLREEKLSAFATEECLLNYFDIASSAPAGIKHTSHCHDHREGVIFSWRKPMMNDRYMCILLSEGIEGVDDVEIVLGNKWSEPSGGIVIDAEWNDIHFINVNWIDIKLPNVLLTLEGAYNTKEGNGAYRRHLSIDQEVH